MPIDRELPSIARDITKYYLFLGDKYLQDSHRGKYELLLILEQDI